MLRPMSTVLKHRLRSKPILCVPSLRKFFSLSSPNVSLIIAFRTQLWWYLFRFRLWIHQWCYWLCGFHPLHWRRRRICVNLIPQLADCLYSISWYILRRIDRRRSCWMVRSSPSYYCWLLHLYDRCHPSSCPFFRPWTDRLRSAHRRVWCWFRFGHHHSVQYVKFLLSILSYLIASLFRPVSEISPRKVRGALVSGYQFCITIGLLLASCVDYATENRNDTGSYRIPICIQFAWGIILATGLFLLPESPRYLVKKGNVDRARHVLSRLRGQPPSSEFIETELTEIIANHEFEKNLIPDSGYWGSWYQCFTGGLWTSNSNLRKTILGTSLQMMQQWTGVNFIFYFSTPFLKSTGAISNSFLTSIIFTIVNVVSTPISFWTMEHVGRRPVLIWGAAGMFFCQIIVGAIGDTIGFNSTLSCVCRSYPI